MLIRGQGGLPAERAQLLLRAPDRLGVTNHVLQRPLLSDVHRDSRDDPFVHFRLTRPLFRELNNLVQLVPKRRFLEVGVGLVSIDVVLHLVDMHL